MHLLNSKVKITREMIDRNLSESTTDINSILLTTDVFTIENNNGLSSLHGNHDWKLSAVQMFANDVLRVGENALDSAKTKQLAYTFYQITFDVYNGALAKSHEASIETAFDLVAALRVLIQGNLFRPWENDSSQFGN